MGDRGQVHIVDEKVWLYTHWGASELIEVVRSALSKNWRWDDSEYLARIIFDEMIGEEQGTETGYGISSRGPHGDEWRIIHVDCKNQTIKVEDDGDIKLEESFENFIANKED